MLIPLNLRNQNYLIFFFDYNLDIAANCKSQFAPNKFSLPGHIVYHTDHDHFGDGVMLLVQNT